MLNNSDNLLQQLGRLGLTRDEAKVYLTILEKPASHLEVSRKTGINRTKVYRIADELEKKSLLVRSTQEEGHLLRASSPKQLEIGLVSQEEHLKAQRSIYKSVVNSLEETFQSGSLESTRFTVKSYEGVSGFKQMLWNELQAEEEILIFGNGTLENLVVSRLWAEKHRQRTTEAGYIVREIVNPGEKPINFTQNTTFVDRHFKRKHIDPKLLPVSQQIAIYNDTVATYHWKDQQKVGFEVVNKAYATSMKAIFENYWKIAK